MSRGARFQRARNVSASSYRDNRRTCSGAFWTFLDGRTTAFFREGFAESSRRTLFSRKAGIGSPRQSPRQTLHSNRWWPCLDDGGGSERVLDVSTASWNDAPVMGYDAILEIFGPAMVVRVR